MDAAIGTWKVDVARSPGLKEFLLAGGTPAELCTDDKIAGGRVTIGKDGGSYTYLTSVPGMDDKTHRYTPGQSFVIETYFGPKFTCTIKEEGGKFVENYVGDNGAEYSTVRTISGNEMTAVTTTSDGKSFTSISVKV